MKRIVSLALFVTFLMTALVGCGKPSGGGGGDELGGVGDPGGGEVISVSGLDAVKLLLAEERLNEQLLKNEGDIFENGAQVMTDLANKARENLGVTMLKGVTAAPGFTMTSAQQSAYPTVVPLGGSESASSDMSLLGSLGEEKQDIGTMEIVGDTVVWKDFGEVSNSYEYFLNLTNNIVLEAEKCAELINFVKKNIRIVNKWVAVSERNRYYLSVGENEELLAEVYEDEDLFMLTVCRRYRNADGKDVYEMYINQSTGFERRMTYIPGERYEMSEGRNQHFIATNTKGYWENYVLGDIGTHYNVSYLILKEDICYTFGFINGGFTTIDILSADRETDLFTYQANERMTNFFLKLNGFTNIEKITAPKSQVEFGENNSWAAVSACPDVELHLTNGTVIKEGNRYADGKVVVATIMVGAFSYGYGPELMIRIDGDPEEALSSFLQFLNETGLRCKRDINTVLLGTQRAISDSKAVFNYYQWNGFTVNTEEGIRQATTAEKAKYEEMNALYRAIENAEIVQPQLLSPEELALHMSFAPIMGNVSSGAKMVGDKLTIDRLTLTVSDVTLFVEDEPYHVVVALEDSAGSIVHLEQVAPSGTPYAGEAEFSVTATNLEIALSHLMPGNYRVVAYIATSEGIRSSKFAAVAFESVEGAGGNFGDVDLRGSIGDGGVLTLTYTERVDVNVTIESQTALTYDAFKQLVCEQAFKYGIPDESAIEVLVGESYETLISGESEIAPGEYRVSYAVENGDYVRRGYVYVTYSVSVEE